MIFWRLGFVGFFGLLVPGAYVLTSLIVVVMTLLSNLGSLSWADLWSRIPDNSLLFSAVFFLFSYLLGVLMLLVGHGKVDQLSTMYFRWIGLAPVSRRNLWKYESFPYRWTVSLTLKRAGVGHVCKFFRDNNPSYDRSVHFSFINFCKLLLEGCSPEISRIVTQAESMVRFLSGTAIALAASVVLWLSLSLVFAARGSILAVYCMAATLLCLLLIWPILVGFKHQRRREVSLVWFGTYLVLTGGVPIAGDSPREDLRVSLFGRGDQGV